jgi:hypothetical protein
VTIPDRHDRDGAGGGSIARGQSRPAKVVLTAPVCQPGCHGRQAARRRPSPTPISYSVARRRHWRRYEADRAPPKPRSAGSATTSISCTCGARCPASSRSRWRRGAHLRHRPRRRLARHAAVRLGGAVRCTPEVAALLQSLRVRAAAAEACHRPRYAGHPVRSTCAQRSGASTNSTGTGDRILGQSTKL